MKRMLLLGAAAALFLVSCSKSNEKQPAAATAAAAISASADGTPLTFNNNTKAVKMQTNGLYTLTIVGFQAAGYSDQIALSLTSRNPITTTTYLETDGVNLSSVNYVKSGAAYISYFSQANPSTVTITAISATAVQGTFSGDVFQLDGSGNIVSKRAISNGKFNLKF